MIVTKRAVDIPDFDEAGINVYLISPGKGNELMSYSYLRTAETMDTFWLELYNQAESVLANKASEYSNLSFEELRDVKIHV